MDEVVGYCPMGCGRTLFVGEGGHITCSWGRCPNPSAVDELLADRETEHVVEFGEYGYNLKHPLRERLDDQLLRCELGGWIGAAAPADLPPGGRYRVRDAALPENLHWEPLDVTSRIGD